MNICPSLQLILTPPPGPMKAKFLKFFSLGLYSILWWGGGGKSFFTASFNSKFWLSLGNLTKRTSHPTAFIWTFCRNLTPWLNLPPPLQKNYFSFSIYNQTTPNLQMKYHDILYDSISHQKLIKNQRNSVLLAAASLNSRRPCLT